MYHYVLHKLIYLHKKLPRNVDILQIYIVFSKRICP